MRIGLIDVDGHRFPNIPLMKISAWHKRRGDRVEWYDGLFHSIGEPFDCVYMSKIFSFTPDYPYKPNCNKLVRGGSGYAISLVDGKEVYDKSKDADLPYEIEHCYPDYSLYPEMTKDTAYGFLSRGCPRGCSFCHVAAKEGTRSYKVADLSEFWSGQKNIVICDPNILACKDWKDLLQQLIDSNAWVDINQGLDIRLINNDNLELLKQIKLKNIHLAFDRWQDKDVIEPKLRLFKEKTGFNRGKGRVMVYILVNFDTTIEQDLYRIELCRELDFSPYPMIYDKAHCKPIYKKLQRYCNNFIFWSLNSFDEYKG